MKASVLIKILELCPDADVSIVTDDVRDLTVVIHGEDDIFFTIEAEKLL